MAANGVAAAQCIHNLGHARENFSEIAAAFDRLAAGVVDDVMRMLPAELRRRAVAVPLALGVGVL